MQFYLFADDTSIYFDSDNLVYLQKIVNRELKNTPLQLVHNYNTRQLSKGNLFISSVNTTQFGKRSAKYAGATLWNNLPPSIREILSSRYFKNS